MPYRPLGPCSEPGCPRRAVKNGRCAVHPYQRPHVARPSAAAQGYGAEWRKLRTRFLEAHPDCQAPGCRELATQVDHITPKSRGGTDDEANLQALCRRHHSQKTALYDGGFGRKGPAR